MGAGARRRSPRRLPGSLTVDKTCDTQPSGAHRRPSHGIMEQSLTQSPLDKWRQAHSASLTPWGRHIRTRSTIAGRLTSTFRTIGRTETAQTTLAPGSSGHPRRRQAASRQNTHSVKARLPAGTEPFNALRPRDATVFHTSLAFWTILVCLVLKRRPPTAAGRAERGTKTDL